MSVGLDAKQCAAGATIIKGNVSLSEEFGKFSSLFGYIVMQVCKQQKNS